jgi:ABC-type polysaccharide/polyol phosphate export permease
MQEKAYLVNPLIKEKYLQKQSHFRNVILKDENSFWFNMAIGAIILAIAYFFYRKFRKAQREEQHLKNAKNI